MQIRHDNETLRDCLLARTHRAAYLYRQKIDRHALPQMRSELGRELKRAVMTLDSLLAFLPKPDQDRTGDYLR